MLTKLLLAETLLITGMLVTFVHQQLLPTRVTVGETEVIIKAPALPTPAPNPVTNEQELLFPVSGFDAGAVISVFGDRRGTSRLHEGIDIKAPQGTPVVAVVDGFVERIKEGGSGGRQLYLRDGKGRLFYYAHLADWSVEEFQPVTAGEVLGTVGKTGNARNTIPHLHFEILLGKQKKAIDPLRFWVGA